MRKMIAIGWAVWLAGCAPGLGKQLRVDNIIRTQAASADRGAGEFPKVRVGRFDDRRGYSEVGEVDGRLLQPAGNVAVNVQAALEEMLRARGIQPSQFSGLLLTGEILEWRVMVLPGFPTTKVQAVASVKIELRSEKYDLLYSAVYTGNGEAEHPFMTQYRVEEALGSAMETALSGAIEDRTLTEKIAAR